MALIPLQDHLNNLVGRRRTFEYTDQEEEDIDQSALNLGGSFDPTFNPELPPIRRRTDEGYISINSTQRTSDPVRTTDDDIMPGGRIPYPVYKAAKLMTQQERQKKNVERLINFKKNLDNFIQDNAIAGNYQSILTAGQDAKYSARRLASVIGRGRYTPMRFFRDAGRLVGNRITGALEDRIVSGISGSGLYGGRGAYNSLFSGGDPSMTVASPNDETETICITHQEYLQDVYGAPDSRFHNEGWKLNPGLMENFPWLSQIAANYEEYEFIQLIFEYRPTVDVQATNNSTGATGTMIMATNYNPQAPIFTNKETMMQYHGAQSGRIVDMHVHGIECDPSKNAGTAQKYVRTQPVIVGQDPKTFDLGTFQLAQVNIPEAFYNQQIGELWVYYTVKLTKPRLYTALGSDIPEFRFVNESQIDNTVGVWNPFGATNVNGKLKGLYMQQNSIQCLLQYVSQGFMLITFPDFITGVFEIQIMYTGKTGGTANPSQAYAINNTVGGNVSKLYDLYGVGQNASNGIPTPGDGCWACSIQDANAQQYQVTATFRVYVTPIVSVAGGTIPDNTVQIQFFNFFPTGTVDQSQLVIKQCNPSLNAFTSTGANVVSGAPIYVNLDGVPVDPGYN